MRAFFRNLFHLYPGEEKSAFLFAGLAFLWSVAVTSGLKYADALFLIHVGPEYLPTTYIFSACIMFCVASVLLRVYHLANPAKIFMAVLGIGICFYIFAFLSLSYEVFGESKWMWYVLRIFGSAFFAVAVTSFWTFIDQYHDIQDAKRLYGLFSSMIFLGVATTGLIMRSGLVEFKYLTLAIIALLFVAIFWIKKIGAYIPSVHDESLLEDVPSSSEQSLKSLFKSIGQSPFTMLLMSGNFLTYILLVLTEYNYLSAFDARFDPGTALSTGGEQNAALTIFLGKCIAYVSISNLIFGLFIYSRLVKRFGSTSLLPVTAVLLFTAYAGWQFSDALIFSLLGYLVVEGTLYVIDDSNFNLMLHAVPTRMKYKIRVIIESFFEPVGMLVSAFVISSNPSYSKIFGLIFSSILLIITLILQRRYFKALYVNLSQNAIHFHRTVSDWFQGMTKKQQKSFEYRLLGMLKLGDEEQKLLAAEGLLGLNAPRLLAPVLKEMNHLSDTGKTKFLKIADLSAFASEEALCDELRSWHLTSPGSPLSEQIQFYLAIQTLKENQASTNIGELFSHLKDPNPAVVRAASIAIAHVANEEMRSHADELLALLKETKDSDVKAACLKALGKMDDVNLIYDIIAASFHFRPSEKRLTAQIIAHMGRKALATLVEVVKDTELNDKCRLVAGRALGLIDLNTLRTHLEEILKIEIERAYFYSYHYQTIESLAPAVNLDILKDGLLSSYHSVLDFIIQLLGVAGEIEDSELLSHAIKSRNAKTKSQVIETLEKTCEPQIYRLLYPLVVDIPEEEKKGAYLQGGRAVLSLNELLDRLSRSSSQLDQIIAAAYLRRLNLPNWRQTLKKQMIGNEEIFHHFANELLEP